MLAVHLKGHLWVISEPCDLAPTLNKPLHYVPDGKVDRVPVDKLTSVR